MNEDSLLSKVWLHMCFFFIYGCFDVHGLKRLAISNFTKISFRSFKTNWYCTFSAYWFDYKLRMFATSTDPLRQVANDIVVTYHWQNLTRCTHTSIDYVIRDQVALALQPLRFRDAEALMKISSEAGVPREILTDMEARLTLLMKGINRMFTLQSWTTTSYDS